MNLNFKRYNDKYFDSCVELLKTTWDFHSEFKNLPDKNLVYKHYFYTCLNWNEHMDVLVDGDENVKGILFGSREDESKAQAKIFKRKQRELEKWTDENIENGNFGDKKVAKRIFKGFEINDKLGEKYAHEFQSEINLFIVSPDLRGKGYGVKLMDRYVEFCRRNNFRKVFLWTDLGCSYSFYEKYGFKIYKRYHSKSLTDGENGEANGMIYSLHI